MHVTGAPHASSHENTKGVPPLYNVDAVLDCALYLLFDEGLLIVQVSNNAPVSTGLNI